MSDIIIVGGGLAGTEAAWQAAERGLKVQLFEMRPKVQTGAHTSNMLAELVCSNSLGSKLPDRAPGVLKNELRKLGSLLLEIAEEYALPAGGALAVDRDGFAGEVTRKMEMNPNIEIIREEVTEIPKKLTIIASGPLTSQHLSESIAFLTGSEHLYFFDAIAPIVNVDSIDLSIAYRASRFDRGDQENGDYINCPLSKDEYYAFVETLVSAERIVLKEFELELENGVRAGAHKFFEGCLPIEILAQRGKDALAFGPMRPVGLRDPFTGKRPFAVLQLRQDNYAGSLYNMVGFQTNLTFTAQRKIFRMIPGLKDVEFSRFGQMHRNTFIFSPAHLRPTLQSQKREDLFFAGQITGVEGYAGNIATGLLAGWNAARLFHGKKQIYLPPTTMLGALCQYITQASPADFQPMKANFGILPSLGEKPPRGKRQRATAYARRSADDLSSFLAKLEESDSET